MAKKFTAAQRLATEADFSDAASYEKLRNEILDSHGKDFFTDFFDAIPKSKFREYIWLREELSYREHLNLCLELFNDTPNAEIENEISNILARISPERKIQLPPQLLLKEKFWCRANFQSKLAALKQFSEKFATQELCKKILEIKSKVSLEELIAVLKENLSCEKFLELIGTCAAQSTNFNDWAKIILANDLPPEIILPRWDELTDDNKRAAFLKYFDELPADKLAIFVADLEKILLPAEILDSVKDKATFREKFPELVGKCAAQSPNFNNWAKTILDNDLPHEIILKRWDELTDDNKRVAFVKYFDELPIDKIINMVKNLSPAEFVDKFSSKKTFNQKLPAIIEHSHKKFDWAQCLVDNVAIFKHIAVVDDDVMIFFMYEWVKREKPLHELTALIQEKIDAINASLYAKIVYLYICAAHEKNINSGRHSELMNQAQKAVAEIFNKRVKALENQSLNPIENFNFDTPEAHVLPPCNGRYYDGTRPVRVCSFCEAVVWSKKVFDEDEHLYWENHSWCRRLESADLDCSRLFPNIELSAKDWSLIELTDKLNLRTYEKLPKDHKFNLEIFTRFGGELNRLNELRKRIKCRECGQYMRADRNASRWLTVQNIIALKDIEHFPVLIATFECQNDDCREKGKSVYLSYCWHCGETIDSRDSKVKIAGKGSGYYLCNKCGAGYKDYISLYDENRDEVKYAIFPGTICPSCTKCTKCGGQEFKAVSDDEKFKLKCIKCRNVMNVPLTIEEQKNSNNNYKNKKNKCSKCGHELQWNIERLGRFVKRFNYNPIIWA